MGGELKLWGKTQENLSDEDMRVMWSLAMGYTLQEIADELNLSLTTIWRRKEKIRKEFEVETTHSLTADNISVGTRKEEIGGNNEE